MEDGVREERGGEERQEEGGVRTEERIYGGARGREERVERREREREREREGETREERERERGGKIERERARGGERKLDARLAQGRKRFWGSSLIFPCSRVKLRKGCFAQAASKSILLRVCTVSSLLCIVC